MNTSDLKRAKELSNNLKRLGYKPKPILPTQKLKNLDFLNNLAGFKKTLPKNAVKSPIKVVEKKIFIEHKVYMGKPGEKGDKGDSIKGDKGKDGRDGRIPTQEEIEAILIPLIKEVIPVNPAIYKYGT